MNEDMKVAWLEISELIGEPTREELDVFMRTWQRAVQATRKALAEQPAQQCWKCGDMDAAFQAKCDVPACGMMEQPAQRKPLTDDELADLWYKQSLDWMEFARAIESKLKEKNT